MVGFTDRDLKFIEILFLLSLYNILLFYLRLACQDSYCIQNHILGRYDPTLPSICCLQFMKPNLSSEGPHLFYSYHMNPST